MNALIDFDIDTFFTFGTDTEYNVTTQVHDCLLMLLVISHDQSSMQYRFPPLS